MKSSMQTLNDDVVTKELSPGILLHKQIIQRDNQEIYIYKVEVLKMQTLEFTVDFNGSENVDLEGSDNLMSITTIQPFSIQVVARLMLGDKWKLKQKFKVIQKPTARDIQLKFIQPSQVKLRQDMQKAFKILCHIPFSVLQITEAFQILEQQRQIFIDQEFQPCEESVYGQSVEKQDLTQVIQWRRPKEFIDDQNAQLNIFNNQIEPLDIKQGNLGDCWFMSAVASLAERPQLVERLFVTKECNPSGIYRIKLCKNGEWVIVTIDDYFPCQAMGGPIFSRANGNELWVLLLEKAYAKLHGNYQLLKGGYCNEALIDLTGCPSRQYDFSKEDIQKMIQSNELWKKMLESDNLGYLMTASTPGEDRWSDAGVKPGEETNGLLPGHAYSLLQVKEFKEYKIVCIRNPWGAFEWNGDWSDKSALWTQDAIQALKPLLQQDDGQFWMSFDDFIQNFSSLNICQVKNWDELRIKGKFVKTQDQHDPNIESVISKWYYSVEIKKKTQIIVGLHQEDERIIGVAQRRSYLDIGLIVLKRLIDGSIALYKYLELEFDRQVDVDLDLEPGSYIILPRTTGCMLRRPFQKDSQVIIMIDRETNRLNEIVESTVVDIFRKFDMLMTRELTFVEFKGFYESISKEITLQEFEKKILKKYNSTSRGITQKGFIDFFKDSIMNLGEEEIQNWFNLLGYDQDLYSVRSRCFMLSFHSQQEISVIVRDNVATNLDGKSSILISKECGKDLECRKGIRAFYTFNKNIHAYTYVVVNDQTEAIDVTFDCTNSKNMLFTSKHGIVQKRVEPGQYEFIMHSLALPSADNFLRSAKITWNIVDS